MKVSYINSKGEKIDFLSNKIAIQNIESLFVDKWEYSSMASINFGGKIKKFYKGLAELPVKLSIVADTEKEFSALMKRLHDVFTYDIRTKQSGRLYVNDSYLECWFYSSSYSEYEDLFYITDKDYTLVTPRPMWITERKYVLDPSIPINNSVVDYAIVDYALVDTDKRPMEVVTSIISNEQDLPVPITIDIQGYASAPRIEIGDNIYDINIEIPENGHLLIDGLNKYATLYDQDGDESNAFGYRDSDYDLFAEIPPGAHEVLFNGTSPTVITLYEERGEPSWT